MYNCRKRVFRLLAAAALGALPPLAALGQVQAVNPDALPDDAAEAIRNVTVNDSPEARKDIGTARDLERQKEWLKAAGWYQGVLEKYRTRVVAWRSNDQKTVDRYRGIVYEVQQSLAQWPAEGVAAYRSRYEATAAALLESAAPDDASVLNTVLQTYFVTDAAKVAALRLIDLHMEAGEFDAAAQIGDLLLDLYPAQNLIVERPRVLFRTALADHLCNNEKAAAARADELAAKFADATGSIFGKDVILSKSLGELLKAAAPSIVQVSADAWTMFGGSPDRARVSSAPGHIGAKIASVELPRRTAVRQPQQINARAAPFNAQIAEAGNAQADEDRGMTLGIMPVADNGELFFQDGAHLWARSLDSDFPLGGWAGTYPDDKLKGVYSLRNAGVMPINGGVQRGGQYTVTLTDTTVLAIMGQSSRLAGVYIDQFGAPNVNPNADTGTRLVCLDRKTGQEKWKTGPASLAGDNIKDDERERLRALDFSGSPLVVGDNVYVTARGGKDMQFENCYVVCLDLANGRYRWSALVASANAPANAGMGGEVAVSPATLSHMAFAGGRLYVNTNLGALAAIDAYDGSVVWLSLYQREAQRNAAADWQQRRFSNVQVQSVRPWEYNPVIAQDGKLWLMPLDSKYLLLYDAASGKQLKAIDLSDFQPNPTANIESIDPPHALIGVINGTAVLSGATHVYTLNAQAYDTKKSFIDNVPAAALYSTIPSNKSQDTIRGRAFLAGDSVLVTTDKALARLNFKKGLRLVGSYPADPQEWSEEEGPGNVIASGEHVVIATAHGVNVYTDMSLARAKLDKAVADAPTDVKPRLAYAEVMFAAGESDVALTKLTDAADMLGGIASMRPGDLRNEVFGDALKFAEKLARDKQGKSNDAAIKFYDLAAAAADVPHDQVTYRFSRAKFGRENHDAHSLELSVRLFQDVLSRPEWRTQPAAMDDDPANPGSGGVAQAGAVAFQQIAAIKKAHPDAYAAQEKQAVAAIEAAKAANDATKLLAVAVDYPNADVAPKAMLQAAAISEKAGNYRQATQVLRGLYRNYDNAAEKAGVVEAMARNYLRLPGGFDIAIARLTRATALADARLTQPLTLPDGKTIQDVTFKQAAAALVAARPSADGGSAFFDLHVPDRHTAGNAVQAFAPPGDARNLAIKDVTALLQTEDAPAANVRPDRVVVALRESKVALFAPGGAEALGVSKPLADPPLHASWLAGDSKSVVAWSASELVALDGQSAATKWTWSLKSSPPDQMAGGGGLEGVEVLNDTPPGANNPNTMRVEGNVIINGQIRNGRIIRGQVRQPAVPAVAPEELPAGSPEQVRHVVTLSDRVVVATSAGRVICLSAAEGKLLWQTSVSTHVVEKLIANEDFSAVRVSEDGAVRLIVLDNFNGQVETPVRSFPAGQGMVPQNFALSPDGMLVWTLPDRLCGKDLYEPGKGSTFEFPPRDATPASLDQNGLNRRFNPAAGNGQMIYNGCTRDAQLLIRGDKILTVESGGVYLVAHALETGAVLTHDDAGKQTPTRLSAGAPGGSTVAANTGDVNITLATAGPYVYILGPRSLMCYNLDRPAQDQWLDQPILSGNPNYQLAVPTKTELLVVAEPSPRHANEPQLGAPNKEIRLYDRRQVKDDAGPSMTESGKVDFIRQVNDPSGIKTWQAVEGGIYYVTGDQTLHYLAGLRQ